MKVKPTPPPEDIMRRLVSNGYRTYIPSVGACKVCGPVPILLTVVDKRTGRRPVVDGECRALCRYLDTSDCLRWVLTCRCGGEVYGNSFDEVVREYIGRLGVRCETIYETYSEHISEMKI